MTTSVIYFFIRHHKNKLCFYAFIIHDTVYFTSSLRGVPTTFLLRSYYVPTTFLLRSCDVPATFLRHSHDVPTTFLRRSYDVPTTFLRRSHDVPTTFLRHSHDVPATFPRRSLTLRYHLATPPFCRICNLAENKIGNLPLELRSLATEGTQEFPPLKRCRYSHDILSLCDNGSYKLPFLDAAEFGNSAELTLFFHKNSSFCTCRLDTCLAN